MPQTKPLPTVEIQKDQDGNIVNVSIADSFWVAFERWRRLQKMRKNPQLQQFGFGKKL